MLVIPYKSAVLLRALRSLKEDEIDKKTLKKVCLEKAKKYFPKDQIEFDKKVAIFHGLKRRILINSKCYNDLMTEYCCAMILKFIEDLKNGLIISDVQAWALLSENTNVINAKVEKVEKDVDYDDITHLLSN